MLADRLRLPPEDIAKRVLFIMSGGTEGVMTPHMTVFSRSEVTDTSGGGAPVKALATGIAHTRAFAPEELGTMVQVRAVEAGVCAAMASAEIGDPADVHFVQIKCPLLTAESILDAERRGQRVATTSNHTRHARAAVSAVIASVIGDPMVYVSGGAEHQGPSGGGPVAAIVRRG
jgi:cyanuric acid amidohydrolase